MTLQSLDVEDNTVVFIDAAVTDAESLQAGIQPGIAVILLDPTQDGITQITQALQARSNLRSIQILSHAEPGNLQLGSSKLNSETIDRYSAELHQWEAALAENGDLLLYGCNLAAGETGLSLVNHLSQLTGADVAASNTVTGRDGNWNLEIATGTIAAAPALSAAAMAAYQGNLGIVTVNSAADSGRGSLRSAIAAAKPGDTVQFAAGLAGKTIALKSQIEIPPGKNLTIDAAAARDLTISGSNASRIFYVNSNQDRPIQLTLKNLTLANAYTADQGGAILGEHKAAITVQKVKFKNNVADKGGSAIFSRWENTLTVTNSQFDGNKAIAGNDERGATIAFVSPGAITVRNSRFSNNKGINGAAINSLNGKLVVENSQFINNDTDAAQVGGGENPTLRGYGGAIYTDRSNNSIVIKSSRFDGNRSKASGGAIHLFADPEDNVSIDASVFTNNKATGLAGGEGGKAGAIAHIRNSVGAGKFTLSNSTIANNTGYDQGGGLWVYSAPTTITNSTFSGNKLFGTGYSNVGGGMTLYSDTEIINTTIANNYAGWVGGGISAPDNAKVSVKNTIFYSNTADNGNEKYGIQQHTNRALIDNGGNIQFPPKKTSFGNDNNATDKVKLIDPKLGALKDNGGGILTHALLAGSPAINTGVSNGAPTTDERGIKRDGKVDIGAFEFNGGGTTRSTALAHDSLLRGGLGADGLTQAGGNRFRYAGASQPELARSQADAADSLIHLNAGAVSRSERIQLNDIAPTLADRPTGLFNAGTGKGKLSQAVKAAYSDKDQQKAGKQTLAASEAVFFRLGNRTYLSVNDNQRGFNSNRDLLLDMTGIKLTRHDATAGVLKVANYFE
ncbi:DUF4347 domain-containing protein [Phormidium tenue FACHB-886]|nr:DUF4347 domain-containing protein [Phormidium tenue FACHB-886]